MRGRKLWLVVSDAMRDALRHPIHRLGAAIAFYTMFTLSPLLLLLVAMTGVAFEKKEAEAKLVGELWPLLGQHGTEALKTLIAAAKQEQPGLVASLLGGGFVLYGTVNLFVEIQGALDTVWDVRPKEGRKFLQVLQSYLLPFSLVLGGAFLILVSVVLSTVLSSLSGMFGLILENLLVTLSGVISVAVIAVLFSMIYWVLPHAVIAWRDVWLGAVVTSLLFAVGKISIGWYLGRTATTSVYGAAASFAVLLLWSYYSAQIFLFGAELTKASANHYGSGIVPSPDAERVGRCDDNPENETRNSVRSPEFGR